MVDIPAADRRKCKETLVQGGDATTTVPLRSLLLTY
jgi:hypothetical protein